MRATRVARWVAGAIVAVVALGVMGCEDDDEGDITKNPDIPAGVRTYRGEEQFVWKFQPLGYRCPSGRRVITRWPSYLHFSYGLTGENSYVMAGKFRMEFYKYDEDGHNGMKASYAICGTSVSDYEANQKVVLYKDGKPFAFAIVPNPAVRYGNPLP